MFYPINALAAQQGPLEVSLRKDAARDERDGGAHAEANEQARTMHLGRRAVALASDGSTQQDSSHSSSPAHKKALVPEGRNSDGLEALDRAIKSFAESGETQGSVGAYALKMPLRPGTEVPYETLQRASKGESNFGRDHEASASADSVPFELLQRAAAAGTFSQANTRVSSEPQQETEPPESAVRLSDGEPEVQEHNERQPHSEVVTEYEQTQAFGAQEEQVVLSSEAPELPITFQPPESAHLFESSGSDVSLGADPFDFSPQASAELPFLEPLGDDPFLPAGGELPSLKGERHAGGTVEASRLGFEEPRKVGAPFGREVPFETDEAPVETFFNTRSSAGADSELLVARMRSEIATERYQLELRRPATDSDSGAPPTRPADMLGLQRQLELAISA